MARTPRMSSRATNLTVLAVLLLVFATGVGAVATGSARGAWIVVAHGIGGIALLFLIPWKAIVVRRGWRRGRATRWVSLVLAILVLAAIGAGIASATGLLTGVGGFEMLWWHVAVALGLVPLLLFHLATRRVRLHIGRSRAAARTPDPGRRTALRLAAVAGLAVAGYIVAEAALRLTGAPGARRRFTGSHEVRDIAAMPVTIWLNDRIPAIDAGSWRLTVVDGAGRRELDLAALARHEQTVRTVLDCTSGWYAEHEWSGAPVSALVTPDSAARSLYVHSVTGYWVRLPVEEIGGLLLATRVAGQVLRRGHGHPLRLVAPGRRGFWWVKWVDRIELSPTPAWWQPPFPLS